MKLFSILIKFRVYKYKLMDSGVHGHLGALVTSHVQMVPNYEHDNAHAQQLQMVDLTVWEMVVCLDRASMIPVQVFKFQYRQICVDRIIYSFCRDSFP